MRPSARARGREVGTVRTLPWDFRCDPRTFRPTSGALVGEGPEPRMSPEGRARATISGMYCPECGWSVVFVHGAAKDPPVWVVLGGCCRGILRGMGSGCCRLWAACVVVCCVLVVVPVAGAGIGDVAGSVGNVVSADVAAPVAGALDAASAPVVEVVAPLVESVAEPVSEVVEPVVEVAQPVLDAAQPVVDKAAPIVDAVNSAIGTASGNAPTAGTTGGTSSPAASPGSPVTPAPVVATPPVVSMHPESGGPTAVGLVPGLTETLLSSETAVPVAGDALVATLVSGGETPWLGTAEPDGSAPAGFLPDLPSAPVVSSPAGVAPAAIGFALLGLAATRFPSCGWPISVGSRRLLAGCSCAPGVHRASRASRLTPPRFAGYGWTRTGPAQTTLSY